MGHSGRQSKTVSGSSRLFATPQTDTPVRIAVLGDSLEAVAPHTTPSWPERLEGMLNALGASVEIKNYAINQHTFYQANTEALFGTLTAVDSVVAWVPDVVIASFGWNDAIVQADSRTVAQIKTDAEDLYSELRSGLPNALLIFAEHMAYDNVNFDSATSIKNKGVAPAYMEKDSAGIYANLWYDGMLETTVSAGLLSLYADYDDVIDHVKTNISEVDANIDLHYFYCARLGCCTTDGLHLNELGQQLMASWVLKELQSVSAFTDLVNPIADQQITLWTDPDTFFGDYLTDSGDGFTLAYPSGPSYEHVPTQWARMKDLNPDVWYLPYKGYAHVSPITLNNDYSAYSIGYVAFHNAPPGESADISVNGAAWIGLSGTTTDNNGFEIYRFNLTGLALTEGANTLRFRVADEVYPEVSITVNAPLTSLRATATTTELEDIADAINTGVQKAEGVQVFNTTTNRPLWAAGNADGDVWVDSAGATVHTPV